MARTRRAATFLILVLVAVLLLGCGDGLAAQRHSVRSAWAEPTLVKPISIDLSTAAATQPGDSWALDQSRDYRFYCSHNPTYLPHQLSIWGGNHVVISGCVLRIESPYAAYPHDQRGELYMSNDDFTSSAGYFKQGIQMQQPGRTTVVMRDVLIGSQLRGSLAANHAECIQTWSGPQRLLIDGFQCSTTYQGLFLLPNQWDQTTVEKQWDLRNVEVDGHGAYDYYLGDFGPHWSGIPDLYLANVRDCGPGEPRLSENGRNQDYDGSETGTPQGNGTAWRVVRGCDSATGPLVRLGQNWSVLGTGSANPQPLPDES